MFISRVHSKGKDGREYVSVLLRQSKRVGKKVVSKTLAILTDLPDWLLNVVENAVKNGKVHGSHSTKPWKRDWQNYQPCASWRCMKPNPVK